jgi:hypothetical protein
VPGCGGNSKRSGRATGSTDQEAGIGTCSAAPERQRRKAGRQAGGSSRSQATRYEDPPLAGVWSATVSCVPSVKRVAAAAAVRAGGRRNGQRLQGQRGAQAQGPRGVNRSHVAGPRQTRELMIACGGSFHMPRPCRSPGQKAGDRLNPAARRTPQTPWAVFGTGWSDPRSAWIGGAPQALRTKCGGGRSLPRLTSGTPPVRTVHRARGSAANRKWAANHAAQRAEPA